MGFFKKVKKVAKKIKNVAPRVIAGVATGGTTEVLRATGTAPGAQDLAESLFAPRNIGDLQSGLSTITNPGQAFRTALTGQDPNFAAGGNEMGGNFLGGLGGILQTVSGFGGTAGTAATLGSSFLSGFLPAQGPRIQQAVIPQQPVVQTMAAGPMIKGAASAVAAMAAPILNKVSLTLGKNITLRAAMIIIRRLGKFLQSPAAIAAAIGLSVSELSTLLTVASIAGSGGRRMNVGNVKALRRAHRRIRGFHKLCGDNDKLKAPRRRSPAKKTIICN